MNNCHAPGLNEIEDFLLLLVGIAEVYFDNLIIDGEMVFMNEAV